LYEYGDMPPEPTTEMAPVDPPLHATLVDVETDNTNWVGSVMVTERLEVQPLLSFTTTE
jgi:hypothetical protein